MTESKTYLGHFVVGGADHAGQLVIDGRRSSLEIYGEEFLHIPDQEMKRVIGVARDGQSITCVNCVGVEVAGSTNYYGNRRHFLSLFPNRVLIGPRHLDPREKEIVKLTFCFTKANMLFYDWGTFGHIIYEHPLSYGQKREILQYVRKSPRRRRRGGRLDLYFHWDREPIIEVKTALGTITAHTDAGYQCTATDGLNLQGQVRVHVKFSSPQELDEVLRIQFIIMEFFEFVAQGRQNLTHIEVAHKDGDQEAPLLLFLSHDQNDEVDSLEPTDALVNGGIHSEEFERMLKAWLETHDSRSGARRRFVDGFRSGGSYSADRLVGAANAFDLLPAGDFGSARTPSPDVEALISAIKTDIDKAATSSKDIAEYRERLRNALGSARRSGLRSKILACYADLPADLKKRLPEMEWLVGHCVRARNFFVHGTEEKMTADQVYSHATFFTDTLEFIFAAYELKKCGWDVVRWLGESFSRSRLKWYIRNYKHHLALLKETIGGSA